MREDIKVKDVMTSPAVVVPLGTTLDQVAALMLERRIGSVLVVDAKGRLVGIVTESDFLKEKGIPFSTFRAPLLLGRFLNGGQLERILQEAKATRVATPAKPTLNQSTSRSLRVSRTCGRPRQSVAKEGRAKRGKRRGRSLIGTSLLRWAGWG